ncbi:helix-turn-helix domain-containing protein [Roseivirga thermotolerans]|uniref:helix-turn-helix domain-containing protein n=1 Tax=Roseivirga thermotolerans TaxID=1758176 RepID=UPI00273FA0FE|nr:helix-turn-helix domain-containing protein [Roseivirga thermotolerans]
MGNIVFTERDLTDLLDNQAEKIIQVLSNSQIGKTHLEYLTSKEFMAQVKIGRSKFDQLIAENTIKHFRKGRKIMIPASEVKRYFEGE